MIVQAAKALETLGFSEIEALIYCFLLKESPATGYRISHAIGKPTANTYKAIAALAQQGAIVVDESENRLCRAVPPAELLDRLDRDFDTRRDLAEGLLSKIRPAPGDDRVYQLADVDQVLERARAMLAGARSIALLDAFPTVLAAITRDLEAAAKRGVEVVVRAYAPMQIHGATVLVAEDAPRVLEVWPGEQLNIAVDAEQYMLALLAREAASLHQAIWSNSTFLACMQHNALASELMLTHARGRNALERLSLTRAKPPGLKRLMDRYAEAKPARAKRTTGAAR